MFGKIFITITGKVGSGKSLIGCIIEKGLKDVGFNNIEVATPIQLHKEKRAERMNNIEQIINDMDKSMKIVIKEEQLPR